MFFLNKIMILGLLLFLPLSMIEAHDSIRCKQRNKVFKLKDLKGTYIGSAITAGGTQPVSSADVLTAKIRENGTGTIPFLTVRDHINGQTILRKYITSPSALPPARGTLQIFLNPDGTGEMLVYGFPLLEDIFHIDIVLQKQNGKVTKFFGLETSIEGPSADTPIGQEIKLFTFERQFE